MTPIQIVETLYSALKASDEAAVRTVLHEDVEWNQCEGFPGGDRHRGADVVLNGVFAKNRDTWSGFRAPVEEMLESGNTVVVLGHYAGTHAATGRAMRAAFAHVYRVRDDRIVRFDQITDTAPMVAAAAGG